MDYRYIVSRTIKENLNDIVIPWQIDLDFTNSCNHNCYYCNSEHFRKREPKNQDYKLYQQLINQLSIWHTVSNRSHGRLANIILSGGGEPTLFPHYEKLVEQALDLGFKLAMNTNGVNLDKLLSISTSKLKNFSYIGLDIDSAVNETYNHIRNPNNISQPHLNNVEKTAREFGRLGLNLDVKSLLMQENTSEYEIDKLFEFAKRVQARKLHLRPIVIDDKVFEITDQIKFYVYQAAQKHQVKFNISTQRLEPRTYTKCHQFFLAPSFCSDGKIYLCCEYKGDPNFAIGSWLEPNWQKSVWFAEKHKDLYRNFTVDKCKPCRPNPTNNLIQNYLDETIDNFFI